jgi:molecular chaperone DnaJ
MYTHYQTLQVSPRATAIEIKQAYRQLAKQHHPDVSGSSSDRIVAINAAYEVLSDPSRRRDYDRSLQRGSFETSGRSYGRSSDDADLADKISRNRANRQATPGRRATGPDLDAQLDLWLRTIYGPVDRSITAVLKPFKAQFIALSADPYDDRLMEDFTAYLLDCQRQLKKAERVFHSLPNPPAVAGMAASLYHCLNQLGDAIEEFDRYTTCYSEDYLHTGQELFKIAAGLQKEAKKQFKSFN